MLTFSEWLQVREDNWSWGGADFTGTWTQPFTNTPDYWYNSKYQGKGIRWGEPSDMPGIKKKYGLEKVKKKNMGPIEDRVPKQGKDEQDKEEKEGKIRNRINYGTEEDGSGGVGVIRGESDPMQGNPELRKVEKMYKLTPSYELKNMRK